MQIQTWADALRFALDRLSTGVGEFAPRLVGAIIVFVIGWAVSVALGRLVAHVFRTLKVDKALESVGADEPIKKAGISLDVGAFFGALVKWFFILVFFTATVEVLGLKEVTDFLKDSVLPYLPHVFIAALILVAAALIGETVGRIVTSSAKAGNLPSAGFLGGVSKWAIWIFALLAAMNQLGIAGPMVQYLFIGIVSAISLALGLAFGLGGRDVAAQYLERLRKDISNR